MQRYVSNIDATSLAQSFVHKYKNCNNFVTYYKKGKNYVVLDICKKLRSLRKKSYAEDAEPTLEAMQKLNEANTFIAKNRKSRQQHTKTSIGNDLNAKTKKNFWSNN